MALPVACCQLSTHTKISDEASLNHHLRLGTFFDPWSRSAADLIPQTLSFGSAKLVLYVSSPASFIACWLASLIRIPILRSRPRPLFGLRFPKRLPVGSLIRFSFSNPQCRADAPEGAISPPPVVCRATSFQVSGKRADRCWRPRRRGSADIPPARGHRFSRRPPGRDSRPRCRQNPLG